MNSKPQSKFLRRHGMVLVVSLICVIALARAKEREPTGQDMAQLVAGGGNGGDGAEAVRAKLQKPFAVAFDSAGNMYIGEYEGCRVLRVDPHGVLKILAGSGRGFGGDGGIAMAGQFNEIHDIVVGPDGNLYIADSGNHRVRKIDMKTGRLSTFAGTGTGGKSTGDGGPAERAGLDGVASLWFAPGGETLYLSGFSKFVRTIDMKTGIISTIKNLPGGRSIAVDSKGNLYIASGSSLRVRSPEGTVSVVLDKSHLGGSEQALADNPKHLAIDAQDNVLICDEGHSLLRKYVASDHRLITLAGTGKAGSNGTSGPAPQLELNRPHGVYVQPDTGAIYVADSWNDRVLKIDPAKPE